MLDLALPSGVRGPVDLDCGVDSAGDMEYFSPGYFLAGGKWEACAENRKLLDLIGRKSKNKCYGQK
jgi:hypothetical protein